MVEIKKQSRKNKGSTLVLQLFFLSINALVQDAGTYHLLLLYTINTMHQSFEVRVPFSVSLPSLSLVAIVRTDTSTKPDDDDNRW